MYKINRNSPEDGFQLRCRRETRAEQMRVPVGKTTIFLRLTKKYLWFEDSSNKH